MALCVYCQERKGKRYCPAFDGYICSACCGAHRLVRIQCPHDCPYLESGETYQGERRIERGRSHGREYLTERGERFADEESFAFALLLESVLYLEYVANPLLSDSEVARGLESFASQLGRIVLVEAVPHPLAEKLQKVMKEDPDFEEYAKWSDERKAEAARKILDGVLRFAKAAPGGRGYFEFIARYFREVLREGAGPAPETPPSSGRIVLP
jgi:hypothetical protein